MCISTHIRSLEEAERVFSVLHLACFVFYKTHKFDFTFSIDYSLQNRDRLKHEIDFIIEYGNNDILGVEVKAGSVVDSDSFKHLRWFKNNIVADKNFIGIVLYTGDATLRFGEKMWAVPISILWSD